ncbi:MAG: twin-arginine translocation signal domain-containing protein [Acidobacteria bacterium]|nr:twin-arginine translocation signal domain-containing protein [Acidobacteriota bacterium]
MDRRDFLKSSGVVAAGAAVSQSAVAAKKRKSAKTMAAGRAVLPINRGWKYRNTSTPEAHRPNFDDSSFAKVTIPHTNVMIPWHGFDDKAYEFVSVYRRNLKVPADAAGKRVFVDFEGSMIASTVWLNGKRLGEYRGGYTPFSFEITDHLDPSGSNLLSVDVDSTERKDIPPFGYEVDYLTFGGIYREVWLRVVPQVFIENFHAITKDVLTPNPSVDVQVFLDRAQAANPGALSLRAELRDGDHVIARGSSRTIALPPVMEHNWADSDQAIGASYDPKRDAVAGSVTLTGLGNKIELWDLNHPKLYTVVVQLLENGTVIDEKTDRIGFREATFTDHGFSLNGKIVKLHGLDRHQTFPWVGQAMSGRGQRQDAKILRKDLHCNIVRTSHYPQSRHFLDACDEMGLLVLEEIPGWQHIGDKAWQDVSVDNVRRMVRRDWNRPSLILWGVRINESKDDHDFYTRTNAMAHALDTTRQTCGIRTTGNWRSEFLEDVFTYNDFDWPIKKPFHPRFLNTEFVGHTYPCKTIDSLERLREHTIRHARMHNQLASDPQYSGGLGWCAFDYATHANFGSGDRICYHGVMDIFRTPKPAALFYKSMCDREDEVVLEPNFHWAHNDESVGITYALISSNVDHIKMYIINENGEHMVGEGDPDRKQFAHLKYPPFSLPFKSSDLSKGNWGDLRLDGYIDGKLAISKKYSGKGDDHEFVLVPDETALVADGADAVRVVLRVNDEYGKIRPFAADAIEFVLEGPAELIGDNPFGLIGGTGAIWIRATELPGTVTLKAKHPYLGVAAAQFTIAPAQPEIA